MTTTASVEIARAGPVSFGGPAAAAAAVQVRVEGFQGPLALLLSLIESRELDVMTVRLGELAGAYLDALANLETDRAGNITAFVSVASQLILIKSRALLPRGPDPQAEGAPEETADPEQELRARLVVYRAFRDAAGRLADRVATGTGLYHREAGPGLVEPPARAPVSPLDPALLPASLRRLAAVAAPPQEQPEIVARTVTLTERAAAIRMALRRSSEVVLQELLAETTDRVVRAVTFLAVLELVKRRELSVEQTEPWGPIRCRTLASPATGWPAADLDETLAEYAS